MEGDRCGCDFLIFRQDFCCRGMHLTQFLALFQNGLDDVVGRCLGHGGGCDQNIRDGGNLVVDRHALVDLLLDRVSVIKVAMRFVHGINQLRVVDHLDREAWGIGEVRYCCGRKPSNPHEGIDLAILQRVHRLRDTQALPLNINLRGIQEASRHEFGCAPNVAHRHPLALEIGHGLHTRVGGAHDMHSVGIEDEEGAKRDLAVGKLALTV